MPANQKIIPGKPLFGMQSIKIGLRILVWDQSKGETKGAVFVGKITRIISDHEAIGENYIHDPTTDGKYTELTRLDFRTYGLVKIRESGDGLHPRFRTYLLPGLIGPNEYERFIVTYKTPGQRRRLEEIAEIQARSRTAAKLV